LSIAIISTVASALGITLSYLMSFTSMSAISDKTAELSRVFRGQFYTEHLYHSFVALGFLRLCAGISKFVEKLLIDGIVNASYSTVSAIGNSFRVFQSGNLNIYALIASFGIFSVLILTLFWR
ncbi:MAG: hypothetical protein ABDH18_03275, partial [Aquificaceae bacterium]